MNDLLERVIAAHGGLDTKIISYILPPMKCAAVLYAVRLDNKI